MNDRYLHFALRIAKLAGAKEKITHPYGAVGYLFDSSEKLIQFANLIIQESKKEDK